MRISTFTIIAKNSITGEIVIAGGTNWFCYGRWVPHIEAGVGAIATQADVNMNYSKLAMNFLKNGLSAEETLKQTLKEDPDNDGVYQLLIMDKNGNTSCHTGNNNHNFAGCISQKNLIVAGNTLVDKTTLNSIVDYYNNSDEEFGLKVIKALQAGKKSGGDIRGMKSAALKFAKAKNTGDYWNDLKFDIRVDENTDPLLELERLYIIACAYGEIGEAEEASSNLEALTHYKKALDIDPTNTEIKFWIARIYASLGKSQEASKLLKEICTINPLWNEYWKRLDSINETQR